MILEIIASLLILANVYLLTKQNILAWPLGIIACGIYIWIFYDAELFSDTILNIIYVVLNIYGWWYWTYGDKGKNADNLSISKLSVRTGLVFLSTVLMGTWIWGYTMLTYTSADFAYADAFTTVASLGAQILLARKKIENWYVWIVVDVVALCVYHLKELNITSILYLILVVLCIKGLFEWRKELNIKID